MDDHATYLFGLIDALLEGELAFPTFARTFYDYYIDAMPETALTEREREFLSTVQERLDWTTENPDRESRQYGWVSNDEYLAWLRDARISFDSAARPLADSS